MKPQMVKFFEGWAAMADSWMVCAFTHDKAKRRFVAADLHGQPYPQRLPRWVSCVCWGAALYVSVVGVIDGGGRLNAALFFALAVVGLVSTVARTEVVIWLAYLAENCPGAPAVQPISQLVIYCWRWRGGRSRCSRSSSALGVRKRSVVESSLRC